MQGTQPQDGALELVSVPLPDAALISSDQQAEFLDLESLLGQVSNFEVSPERDEASSQDLDSLLAQTLLLDQRSDTALRDGSFVWSQQGAEGAAATALHAAIGAQPHIAAGQAIATVAAGVQQPVDTAKAFFSSNEPAAMAAAVMAQAGDVADAVGQMAPEMQGKEASSEGRFALQGAWKLEDPQTPPTAMLQRLMGQIEQWAVAGAGALPKAVERAESSKSFADSASWLANGQGSGMRLTENAVRETQQSQTTAFEAEQEAPVEDMRFWLQGKQQRAELTLDRDGQAVRVRVAVNGNEAHVTFHSQQQQTRDMLDASLAQLREMLAQQGVELLGVSVQAQEQESQQGPHQQAQQGDNGAAQQSGVQHAQVAVPGAGGQSRGSARALDVYA